MDISDIFEEVREKGSQEFLKSTEGHISFWHYLLALVVILLIVGGVVYASHTLEPEYQQAGIQEIDGALHFPDGTLVRNYEQLGIYLNTQ